MKTNHKTNTKNILIVNNISNQEILSNISKALNSNNYRLDIIDSFEEAYNKSNDITSHLILFIGTGNEKSKSIQQFKAGNPQSEIMVITKQNSSSLYSEMIKIGVYDCLSEDFSPEELRIKVERAFKQQSMRQELTILKQQVAMNFGFDNIVGDSKIMSKVKETIQKIAPTDISIMIRGESGTGKELTARVIHHHSSRRKNKFLTLDFSVIPIDMLETELFGSPDYRNSIFFKADGGTVYLKDVDKLPLTVQPMLHRFLEDYILKTANGDYKVDVRIISSTTKDLSRLTTTGVFTEELFYKLCELPLNIPTLAERTEDIELLVDYFVRKLSIELNRSGVTINRSAYELLLKYNWPGNIRELENTLKRAITLCKNSVIDGNDIILFSSNRTVPQNSSPAFGKTILKRKNGLLDESQRSLIMNALSDNNWNFTQTAQELGIGRTTLWRKVKKYNLKKESAIAE